MRKTLDDIGCRRRSRHGVLRHEGIPVLLEIPDNRRIAEAYSRGELAVEALPETRTAFERLVTRIERSLLAASGNGRADAHDARLGT